MHQLEQLAVQVSESNRLLDQGGVSRWRISLLLLDNVAELLMKRMCDKLLRDNEGTAQDLKIVRGQIAKGQVHEELPPWLDDGTPPQLLSDLETELKNQLAAPGEIEKIDGDFNRKVSYLIRNGYMSQPHATVLKRLHQYRNEAQHGDKVRDATVLEAGKIYTYVTCSMMKEFEVSSYNSIMPKDLASLLPSGIQPDFSVQSKVADILLAESPIGTPSALSETLSEHLIERLDEILDQVDYLESGMPFETDTPTRDKNLKMIQVNPWTPAPKKILDCRDIRRWRATAIGIARSTEYVKGFEKFAALEMAIEPLEELVLVAVRALDRHIDEEIDRIRGH